MRILLYLILFFTVFGASSVLAQADADSLSNYVNQLVSENDTYRHKVAHLENELLKAQRLTQQERRNIKYLFAAYAVIWVLIILMIFRHFFRVRILRQEVEMLKSMIYEQTANSQTR